MFSIVPIEVTTNGSGVASVLSGVIQGAIVAVAITHGDLDSGADITVTEEATGEQIAVLTNVAASSKKYPRVPIHDNTGAAISGGYTAPIVSGKLRVAVAQGGAGKTGTVTAYVDGALV